MAKYNNINTMLYFFTRLGQYLNQRDEWCPRGKANVEKNGPTSSQNSSGAHFFN